MGATEKYIEEDQTTATGNMDTHINFCEVGHFVRYVQTERESILVTVLCTSHINIITSHGENRRRRTAKVAK